MTRGLVASFRELDATCDAIEELKAKKIGTFTVYTPAPRHEIEHALKPPPSKIRRFTLIGGLCGAIFGYWMAVWTSDYWPLVVGGKAIATWIPYTIFSFELMVLIGGLSTVYGMFILSRVPKITQTVGFDPRFTGSDYGIYVEAPPERLREVEALLRGHGAVEVRNER
ncbi:MAG: DUF3341 domain-containing protein [Gemmatimonadaceae bacterium]